MKVGDLVKNIHAVDHTGLGIIVAIGAPQNHDWRPCYLVRWLDAPKGIPEQSWSTDRWLEKVNDYR